MAATLNHSTDLAHLIINIVPDTATFNHMSANNQINTDELYLVTEANDASLTINLNNHAYAYTPGAVNNTSMSLYAPTTGGTSGQILLSSGTSTAPTWTSPDSTITSSSTGIPTSAAVRNYVANNTVTSMATLTIGTYTYDGSSAVNIPVYDGTIS